MISDLRGATKHAMVKRVDLFNLGLSIIDHDHRGLYNKVYLPCEMSDYDELFLGAGAWTDHIDVYEMEGTYQVDVFTTNARGIYLSERITYTGKIAIWES